MKRCGKLEERKKLYEEIRSQLHRQLEEMGKLNVTTRDIVDDYIKLCKLEDELSDGIDEHGSVVEYDNGGGQTGIRINPAIKEMTNTHRQKLNTLSNLGLRPIDIEIKDDPVEL